MGNTFDNHRHGALMQLNPYIYDEGDGLHKYDYNPGLPVNEYLIPPSFLLQYPSLPDSIKSQINVKGDFYDLGGNNAMLFDQHIE